MDQAGAVPHPQQGPVPEGSGAGEGVAGNRAGLAKGVGVPLQSQQALFSWVREAN